MIFGAVIMTTGSNVVDIRGGGVAVNRGRSDESTKQHIMLLFGEIAITMAHR